MSTGNALFGRQYLVTISSTDDAQHVASYGNFTSNLVNTSQGASDLRVEFDIVKNAKDTPNKGSVSITNMASVTRRSLRPGMQVVLTAGYVNLAQVLFKAGVFLIKTERQGPDTITSMELLDGDAAIANITFDKTYAAGIKIRQIFLDMVAALGTPTPFTPLGIAQGPISGLDNLPSLGKGFTASGPLRQTMGDLCRNFGLEWSIQDGKVQINPLDQHIGNTGEVISMATGMLGVPSFDGTVCTVKCLLNPRLQPGKLVSIQSEDVTGTFKIRGGHWKGDSHGDEWTAELECIPMAATATALAAELGANLKDAGKATKKATAAPKKAAKKLTSKTIGSN